MALSTGALLGVLTSASASNAPDEERVLQVQPQAAPELPKGFAREVVASGLNLPTAFVHLPGGRILIAEKSGVVRLYKDGALQPTPFIDISDRVNAFWDRGLLGIAADPDFATNGYIYLLYTYENDASDFTGPKTGRLARYTATGDTASPSTEFIMLGTLVGAGCDLFPPGADCIPSDIPSHSIGNLKFAPDGTLFLTLGDASSFEFVDPQALRAQDLDSLAGKLLHLTRTGQGVPSNPFWTGDASANRSKVHGYGLRNAYRLTLRPGTSTPYLGDVGWGIWEELDVARPGANFGWPCYEGPSRQEGYAALDFCQQLYDQGPDAVTRPLYSWNHNIGQTVTAGTFYTGTAYPETYRGAFFFADYSAGWIASLEVDANDQRIPGSLKMFATSAGGPVYLDMGPDSLLYAVDILSGELQRFTYSFVNTPPTAVASASPTEGYPPLTVRFSSTGSADPDGDALQYTWDFGDGSPLSNLPSPEHVYTALGLHTARLTVSDGHGGTGSSTVRISVGNLSPLPTITAPSIAYRFSVGDVVAYAGSAEDPEDGPIPASQLSWTVTLHHCSNSVCHAHPFSSGTGATGSFTTPDHGDEIFFELTLTATDSTGLTGSTSMMIRPQLVTLTLESSPAGQQLVLDGEGGLAPLSRAVIAGSSHTLYAPSPQNGYTFQSWSDSSAQQHTVTVGASDATYTANFAPLSCPAGQYRAEYFNTQDLTGWPALVRCEDAPLSYDWGEGSPAPGLSADQFSVRWTGRFTFPAGTQTFTATADDGVRVYVDGEVLIDAWQDQSSTTYEANIELSAGEHTVTMEYYENDTDAVARLSWHPAPCPVGQFQAEYFDNMDLSGPPVKVSCEPAPISYDWGEEPPAPELGADHFSVRWTGRFSFALSPYTFTTTADDGVRVYVDGSLLMDAWWDQGPSTYQADRWLTPGQHTVVMEYYENEGGAVAALEWSRWF
jgi:glucose/arabinose dehydrogenase